MSAGFDRPLWLLALPVALLIIASWRQTVAVHRLGRLDAGRIAAYARAASVVLLVLALADPRVALASERVDTAFLVDASDSVGAPGRAAALEWVDRALAEQDDGDRAALALFGRDARLEYTLQPDPPAGEPAVVVDGSATDLAGAARLGQGVLGTQHRRRVVLLTDGRQTHGDLLAVAGQLDRAGVALDVVPLPGFGSADLLVEEVRAPSRVREGEAYEASVVIRNTADRAAAASVVVTADGDEIARRDLTAEPGHSEITIERIAGEPGTVRYEARLASGASTAVQNDVGRAAVRVDGPPKVLVLEGAAGLGSELEHALEAAGVPVDRAEAASGLPTLDRLLAYDSTVLVNVPAGVLGESGMATLDAYVRDAGHGVVAIGGEASFGLGGYENTPLEELLPVFAAVTDPQQRPTVAEALVIDTSGSMAACHCFDTEALGDGAGMVEGGVVKTDIAKEAVARAVAALSAQDVIGVLAYNESSDWVIPLQQLPAQDVVDAGLARIQPAGGTRTAPAIRRAIDALRDVEVRLRHIILFTDGFEPDETGLVAVAREAREAGITLSVVATGEGTMDVLEDMAAAGGGRFYPGRDLFSIPNIIALETRFAARPIVNEGRFFPTVTGLAPVTTGLDASPPLRGYLATTAKPAARTLLSIGEQRDPLLVTWQAGLGTASAWLSDATTRWAAEWVTWERFSRFWSDVVKDSFPTRENPQFALDATATSEGVRVSMRLADTAPAGADAVAVVTGPDGSSSEVRLERTSLDTFEALVPGSAEGVYAITGHLRSGGDDLFVEAVTAIRSYSQEYAATEADPGLLTRAAAITGGRVDPDPRTAFAAEGLSPGHDSRQLWPLLTLLGIMLAPIDVGLRRLRLERADWAKARRWLRERARRPSRQPRVAERSAASEGLLAAKARARGQHDVQRDA